MNDNTQPPARVGRKAYRVSRRQPGCRKSKWFGIRLFIFSTNNSTYPA